MDEMRGPFADMGTERPKRGKFILNDKGEVVPAPDLELPYGVVSEPEVELHRPVIVESSPVPVVGPTRIGELLLVDIRVAKNVVPRTRLHDICVGLSDRKACGVIESTLVIDLQEASADDARFLLNKNNWPRVDMDIKDY